MIRYCPNYRRQTNWLHHEEGTKWTDSHGTRNMTQNNDPEQNTPSQREQQQTVNKQQQDHQLKTDSSLGHHRA